MKHYFLIEIRVFEIDGEESTMCDGYTVNKKYETEPSSSEVAAVVDAFYVP